MLEYGTEIWSPTTKYLINDLEYVQRNFTRRIVFKRGDGIISYSQRLIFLKTETLEYRRAFRDNCFCLHNKCSLDFSHLYILSPQNYNNKQAHSLRIRLPSIYTARSFVFRSLAVWNYLPYDFIQIESSLQLAEMRFPSKCCYLGRL